MYIPEFWCGVGACIIAEIVIAVGIAIFTPKEKK